MCVCVCVSWTRKKDANCCWWRQVGGEKVKSSLMWEKERNNEKTISEASGPNPL